MAIYLKTNNFSVEKRFISVCFLFPEALIRLLRGLACLYLYFPAWLLFRQMSGYGHQKWKAAFWAKEHLLFYRFHFRLLCVHHLYDYFIFPIPVKSHLLFQLMQVAYRPFWLHVFQNCVYCPRVQVCAEK